MNILIIKIQKVIFYATLFKYLKFVLFSRKSFEHYKFTVNENLL
jgi:hypothetical protein